MSEALFPTTDGKLHYKLPDYEAVHTAMAQPDVTLQLLWIECCDDCHNAGELPYQRTQFKKYYRQFVQRTKAPMYNSSDAPCSTRATYSLKRRGIS